MTREAGLPDAKVTATTVRHMYVVFARTPGSAFTPEQEAGAQAVMGNSKKSEYTPNVHHLRVWGGVECGLTRGPRLRVQSGMTYTTTHLLRGTKRR